MKDDPIVQEIRKIREEHAGMHRYNLSAIVKDINKAEKKHAHRLVALPPKRYMKPTGS
jgi:hypothetical protein